MKKRSFLTYLNLSIVGCLIAFIYILRNVNDELIFYSAAFIVIVLCASSIFIQIKRFKLKAVIGTIFFGLSIVFVVRAGLDQRNNFYLQGALHGYLPSASLKIMGKEQYNANLAKPTTMQDRYPNEATGRFYPSLPYHQSEAVLVDRHSPENNSVSYRFIFKKPYTIDNKDVSSKWCIVWGVCSYFYNGYADINPSTGEVIGLKIRNTGHNCAQSPNTARSSWLTRSGSEIRSTSVIFP
ncbi:hypothetical protein [Paenibacillus sp. A3]|uniref:hypothetical protein n=1 Tax=Paenibacillus sp. A3 TaxID=1337054 RepID=UPI0012FA3E6E|nr:hypothetical protein [Paenibacillus sp. A3]